jgi:hypothetical protein
MDVPASGGTPRLLVRPDTGEVFHFPDVLPGGDAVLFGAAGHGTLKLAALVRHTGEIKRLSQQGGYPRYVDGGFVVLSDPSGILSAVPFDVGRLEVAGPARPITDKLGASADGDVNVGVSRSGDFAYQAATSEGSRLVQVDRAGTVRDLGADSGYYYHPQVSPDGRRVALVRAPEFSFTKRDIWVFDLQQHTQTRLTFDTTAWAPIWSSDGRRIAYTRFPDGDGTFTTQLVWVAADGSEPPALLETQPGQWSPGSFMPGGRELVYFGWPDAQQKQQIWATGTDSGSSPRQVLATTFGNGAPTISPDGRWLAYVTNESGRNEVYVRPYPGPGGRWQVSLDGGAEPLWSPKGDELYYRDDDAVMTASVRAQTGFEVTGRTKLFAGEFEGANFRDHDYSLMPDGKSFVMLQRVVGSRQALVVTLNWFDQFRGKQ